jgi:YVTN family beta-propeller protein
MRIYKRFVFTMLVGLFALSTVAPSEAGTITFKATATLFEPYGTIPSGDTLTVLFSIDDATGLAISTQVSHATKGSLSSTSTPLETNVFNDAFGGTMDAIAIGGGPNPTGTLGGIMPGSAIVNHIVIDLRGDTSILASTATPTNVATWNAFVQRTLALPAPTNPNGTTSVATIGNFLVPQAAQFFAYVTNRSTGNVSVIDTSTNAVVATVPVGGAPIAVAITPNAAFAYVTNLSTDKVSVINTSTNTVVATVPVGDGPQGVAITPDGALAYVTNSGSNSVSVINTSTNTVVATVPVGNFPVGISITPNGTHAYVVNSFPVGSFSVIDTSTNTVVVTVPVTLRQDVDITPNGAFAYMTGPSFDNVTVIDISTNTVVAVVPVGDLPREVAITPNGAFAYVTNQLSGNVSVINTSTNTVVATVPVGSDPWGVAITPDGAFTYASNGNTQNVSVINTSTNTVVATVPVGTAPSGLAITPRRRLVVTNTNDSGLGSLRQVILDARDNVPSVITFDPLVFPVASPGTISLLSRLPVLNDPGDMIDGSRRGVIVDGSNLSLTSDIGLRVRTSNITIHGLTIQNFPGDGINIQPTSASGETITGVVIRNNVIQANLSDGVSVSGGDNINQIGAIIGGNIISSNTANGVLVLGSSRDGGGGNIVDVVVDENAVTNNAGEGIVALGGEKNNDVGVIITHNSVVDNIFGGIQVNGSSDRGNGGNRVTATISANEVQSSKNPINPLAGDGIGVSGSGGSNIGNNDIQALVSDNLIRNSFGEGLRVTGVGSGSSSSNNIVNVVITGNNIKTSGLGGTGSGNGITITGGPTFLTPATTSGNKITFLVDGNQSNDNRDNGIGVQGSNGSNHEVSGTISNNNFSRNRDSGILLIGRGRANTLKDIDILSNHATGNLLGGLSIVGGDSFDTEDAKIINILVDGNSFDKNNPNGNGILATLGTGPGNVISFDAITNNSMKANSIDGIVIRAGIIGTGATPISGNSADKNSGDGFDVRATGYSLSQNRANDNTGAGIKAVGNTNGGGNRARKNASCNEPNFCF